MCGLARLLLLLQLLPLLVQQHGGMASATTLLRVELPDPQQGGARCLDGTPYRYYISQGTSASQFYLEHQGGGWCQTLEECVERAKSSLGSSATWGPTMDAGGPMSREPKENPLMATWTFVFLPYCDGGSFTGDSTSTATNQSAPLLYYQGLKIRQAVVASLRARFGFGAATDLVVGGCSAGGLAAFLHVDWYAQQVPRAKARGLPDSGFFLDGNYARDGKPNYEERVANMYHMMNSQAGISPACMSKLGYKCLFAYHMLPFTTTPVMMLNSAYDSTMADGQCGSSSGIEFSWANASSVNACGNYIRSLAKKLLAPPSAAFLDSCYHHCGEWNQITIGQLTNLAALELWYQKGATALPHNGYLDQNQPYPCASCCNS